MDTYHADALIYTSAIFPDFLYCDLILSMTWFFDAVGSEIMNMTFKLPGNYVFSIPKTGKNQKNGNNLPLNLIKQY
jgi:hypothetical protein